MAYFECVRGIIIIIRSRVLLPTKLYHPKVKEPLLGSLGSWGSTGDRNTANFQRWLPPHTNTLGRAERKLQALAKDLSSRTRSEKIDKLPISKKLLSKAEKWDAALTARIYEKSLMNLDWPFFRNTLHMLIVN